MDSRLLEVAVRESAARRSQAGYSFGNARQLRGSRYGFSGRYGNSVGTGPRLIGADSEGVYVYYWVADPALANAESLRIVILHD